MEELQNIYNWLKGIFFYHVTYELPYLPALWNPNDILMVAGFVAIQMAAKDTKKPARSLAMCVASVTNAKLCDRIPTDKEIICIIDTF